jgi:hypothetical protein
MAGHEFIDQADISAQKLDRLFSRAFLATELSTDGESLKVVSPDGYKCWISVDKERFYLKFLLVFGFKENVPLPLKLEAVNKMNDNRE